MNVLRENPIIPGTILKKEAMGNVSGIEFLNKIFFITDGIMLSEVKEISGVDSSTLQNWVRRGWVPNSKNKRYSKDTVARILIVNMLRKSMTLENIDFLLKYINGKIGCTDDDIIPESRLYDYICRLLDEMTSNHGGEITSEELGAAVDKCVADYTERFSGAKNRLKKALEIIITSYYSVLLREYSEKLFGEIRNF